MQSQSQPPSFAEAKNRRQKARAAGMDPDYWYAVEYDHKVKAGQATEVVFWKQSIALYRGSDGQLRALENRCAHRQLKLSKGVVEGCQLTCIYHGWQFDGDGQLAHIPHELFGHPMPDMRIRSFPVKERYGLIWIFPGNPELSEQRAIPTIPDLEGKDRWACVPIDFVWKAHHSMIIDNVSDFTHAFLHRKFRPFTDSKLTFLDGTGDRVHLRYDTTIGDGKLSKYFVDRRQVDVSEIELCYEYPYQWSNTDGQIKHWCFVLPIDERTTRAFFLFHFKQLKIPFLPLHIPRVLMEPILTIANRVLVKPLLEEDGLAASLEQEGYERHFEAPIAELSPAVNLFQQLTIRKWEGYLERARAAGRRSPYAAYTGQDPGSPVPAAMPSSSPPSSSGGTVAQPVHK